MATRARSSRDDDQPDESGTASGPAGESGPGVRVDPEPTAAGGAAGEPPRTGSRSSGKADDGGGDSAPKSGTRYLNVSGGPLVYTRDGATVDADTWTPTVNLDALGQRQRRNRLLLPESEL